MASSDSDEEYLDDPIQLIDFEPKGITPAVENCKSVNTKSDFEVTDSDGDLYIEKNNNIFKKSLPRFKKVPITLPVTFFEISRNVELLNRCKLLSVKVVNCVEYPWYHKKHSKGKGDNTMTVERSKIKIRPVTSPYRNLKCDNSKKTPETKESKPSKYGDSKQKNRTETASEDSQVDFKKNHGLIGMKISQTHELPSKTAQERTKKKQEKLNNKTRKVKTSTDKNTNKTCETKSISTKNLLVPTLKDSNNIVSNKCDESKEVNNTISAFKIQVVNKSAEVADTWKIVSSKVESDKVVSHTTDLRTKLKLAKVSKIQEVTDKVFQNDSKTLVNKCDDTKKYSVENEQANVKLVTSRADDSNDEDQSVCFNDNYNAQKAKLTTHKVKHESKSINANFIGCKIKLPDDISTNKSDGLLAVSLEVTNKTITTDTEKNIENKETCKKIYNNAVKITDTEKSISKHGNTTDNKNILNMKLIKPTKNMTKTGEFSNTSQSKNQKLNCPPKNVSKANLIKEKNKNAGQLFFLPTKLNSNIDLTESTIDDGALNNSVQNTKEINQMLIRKSNDNSVQNLQATNPILVKDGGKLANTEQNTKVSDRQVNPCDMKKIRRETIHNSNTNDRSRKIDESNKIKPNSVNVEKHTKNVEPTSQKSLCEDFNSKYASKPICTSLENVRCFNELTNNNPVPNQHSSNNPTLVKQNNPRNLDIIDLTNNCNPVQQQLPKKINSNSELTRSSATNATPINDINFKTSPSGASIETRVTTDSRAPQFTEVRDQPRAFTNINTVTQPYDYQIPLDIPPDAKRYPRVIKISKRHPETTDSIMNNCNYFNGNHLLQLAHNSFDKIPFGQPFKNANKNLIQEQAYLPAYENIRENVPKQQPLTLQQNSGATHSQMLANYHAAAQKIARRPSVSQSLMLNNQNVINTHTSEQVSCQLPTLIAQQNEQNKSQITANNVQSQKNNNITPDQLYKIAHEMLPPTCDVAVIETLHPRHDLNTKNMELQPRQLSKTNLPRIILRKPVTKRQIQRTHSYNQSVVQPHQVPHYLYPSSFGYNAPPNIQPNVPYSQGFEQVHSDINQLPPQNYVHCAPIYDGLPKNMNSLNSVPYDNYWNNHYPLTLPPPPPPPPPPFPKPIQPQQQIKPSTSQTCASYNQPNTSAAKSVTGTTVIGCNNGGPVRKINILGEPTVGTSIKPANTEPPPLKPFQSVRETVNNTNNSSTLTKLTDTTGNGHVKKSPVDVQNSAKQIQDINHTVSSKREMLEELSKLTTIESSRISPVNELKTLLRPSPKPDVLKDKAKLLKNPLTKSNTKQGKGNFIKTPLPNTNVIKQNGNSFNEPLPKSDIKQAEGNRIKRPLPKPDVKQQDANLFIKPLPKSNEKPDEGNLVKRPKPDANQEKPKSLKRKLPEQKETNFIQPSKPGPLSKKLKLNCTTPPPAPVLTAPVVHKGYSPPILPIPTYQKSLEILARSNIGHSILPLSSINQTEYDSADARGERRYSSDKQEKLSKKISLDEYKKRCQEDAKVGELNVNKIKIEIKSESPEQDLGYVSDSTTKL